MAAHSSQSYASIQVDTAGLKELARVLRQAQPQLKKQLFKGLRVAAELVKEEAKFKAQWSSRIPGSLKVGGSGLNLKVVAQHTIAGDAAPFEHKGVPGLFRHPVYVPMNDLPGPPNRWVNQQARPFLAPAVDARINQVVEIVQSAVDDALIAAGFDR